MYRGLCATIALTILGTATAVGAPEDHPDVPLPVTDDDYNGLYSSRGYARGHLAPYAVMGGDRDGDGQLAEYDPDDAQTIYEANYMSNIAPQHHAGFNDAPGLWYELERWIQDELVDAQGHSIWVIAGTVFGPGPVEGVGPVQGVGPQQDISVPPMFLKLVVTDRFSLDEPRVLAFLFPHQRVAHARSSISWSRSTPWRR